MKKKKTNVDRFDACQPVSLKLWHLRTEVRVTFKGLVKAGVSIIHVALKSLAPCAMAAACPNSVEWGRTEGARASARVPDMETSEL